MAWRAYAWFMLTSAQGSGSVPLKYLIFKNRSVYLYDF